MGDTILKLIGVLSATTLLTWFVYRVISSVNKENREMKSSYIIYRAEKSEKKQDEKGME